MAPRLSEYSEIWACFTAPAEERLPQVLVLSFVSPAEEEQLAMRWGTQFVSGRMLARDVRKDARGHYLDLIARIGATPVGGRTLRQALKRKIGCSRWWFLKTSEKDCVWEGDFTYTTLIRLLCIKHVADLYALRRVRLVGAPPEIARALAGTFDVGQIPGRTPWSSFVRTVGKGLLRRLGALLFFVRLWWELKRRPVQVADGFDVLLEAHWDWSVRPATNGSVQDRYFDDLPERLRSKGIRVGWLLWYETPWAMWPRRAWLRDYAALSERYPDLICLERYLTIRDVVLRAFDLQGLYEFLRFDREDSFRSLFRIDGLDLYPVVRARLLDDFSNPSLYRLELLETVTSRACQRLDPKLLLTFLELFLHVKAIYSGARLGSPAIKLWTAQHASYSSDKTFGRVQLHAELYGQPDDCAVPIPDGIFAMGELARRLWLENGFDAEQVLVTGGLRYQHVRIQGNGRRKGGKPQTTVLLIASMNEALDLDMCAAASAATRDLSSVRLLLRDHPSYSLSQRCGFQQFQHRIEVTRGTAEEDLDRADLVVFTHSGMAEEALLMGIPTWQWLGAGFNTSVFVDLEVIPTFTSVPELRRALRAFLMEPARHQPKREVQDLVLRQCFGPDPAGASERICAKIMDLIGAQAIVRVGAFEQ